jgi:hypothetical protein
MNPLTNKASRLPRLQLLLCLTGLIGLLHCAAETPDPPAAPTTVPPTPAAKKRPGATKLEEWTTLRNPFKAVVIMSAAASAKKNEAIPETYDILSVARWTTHKGTTKEVCILQIQGDAMQKVYTLESCPDVMDRNSDITDYNLEKSSIALGNTRLWFIGLRGQTPVFWPEGTSKTEASLKFQDVKKVRDLKTRALGNERQLSMTSSGSSSKKSAETTDNKAPATAGKSGPTAGKPAPTAGKPGTTKKGPPESKTPSKLNSLLKEALKDISQGTKQP